jgi:hypothetical protein
MMWVDRVANLSRNLEDLSTTILDQVWLILLSQEIVNGHNLVHGALVQNRVDLESKEGTELLLKTQILRANHAGLLVLLKPEFVTETNVVQVWPT